MILAALLLACAQAAAGPPDVPAPIAGDAPEPFRLDELLEPIRVENDVPALAAAAVHGGEIVALGATGQRRRGSEEGVTVRDRWHVGSITKSMTATVCALLVQRGELAFDTPLAAAFPELAGTMDPAYRDVTLARLLAHRGGTPVDFGDEDDHALWRRMVALGEPGRAAREVLAAELLARPPALEPNTDFLYSNSGYCLVGAALERATDRDWEELLRTELFEPLGLASAGFGAPGSALPAGLPADEPRGHPEREDGTAPPVEPGPLADNPPAFGPAGTVHLSIEDLARYAAFHLAAARGEPTHHPAGVALLRPSLHARLLTPAAGEHYAFGWNVEDKIWSRGPALTHLGSNRRWFTLVWLGPSRDLAIVVTTNQGGTAGAKACDDAAWALVSWIKESFER